MGIGCDAIALLIELEGGGHLSRPGAVIEIGAQQLSNTFLAARDGLRHLGERFGVAGACGLPEPVATHVVHGNLQHLNAEAPRAAEFWTWLGYEYASIDIDGSPGSIPLDLNYDRAPESAKGKYQLVTNFGTTEHVANQLNAFEVIHDLCAPGGLMIHHVPAQGMFNHGLVNYNPKFFWMLARSNGYQLVHLDFASDAAAYALPRNIIDNIVPGPGEAARRLWDYRATDCLLVVVLKKTFDMPYVAPLDVPTGTRTANKALEDRYWTVFKPDAFKDLPVNRAG